MGDARTMRWSGLVALTFVISACQSAEPKPQPAEPVSYDGRSAREWAQVLEEAPKLESTAESAALLQSAVDAFAVMKGPAVHELRPLLQAERDVTRYAAVTALRRIGEPAAPLAGALLPLLEDRSNMNLRLAALRALAAMGTAARDHRSAAAELLDDPYPVVRIAAIRAVTEMGSSDWPTPIETKIRELAVRDYDGSVRRSARRALGEERYQLPEPRSPIR